MTCVQQVLSKVYHAPGSLVDRLKNRLAEYRLEKNFSEFDLGAYQKALARVEKGEVPFSKNNTFEERAAIYVHEMNKVKHPNPIVDEVMGEAALVRKYKAFKLFQGSLEKGLTSTEADRMANIFLMPDDPVTVNVLDFFSKKRMNLKINQAIRDEFYQNIGSKGLKDALKAQGVLLPDSTFRKVVNRFNDQGVQTAFYALLNKLAYPSGLVLPMELNAVRFNATQIERALLEGADALYPELYRRLHGRMKAKMISRLANRASMAMGVLASGFVFAAAIRKYHESTVDKMKNAAKEIQDNIDHVSDEDKSFCFCIQHAARDASDHIVKRSSAEYQSCVDAWLKKPTQNDCGGLIK